MRLALALVFTAVAVRAAGSDRAVIPQSEYVARRQTIAKSLKGVLVAFARPAAAEEQLRTGFFQEPYFFYLTGWTEPDAIMLLTKDTEELFLPPRNERYERYYGHKTSPTDPNAVAVTGFKKIFALSEFERELFRLAADSKVVDLVNAEPQSPLVKPLFAFRPNVAVEDATKQIDALRVMKSPAEVAMIQVSVDASIAAHREALRELRPDEYEFQIAAAMEKTWSDQGCERPAYSSIIASGPDSVVLHYSANKRKIQAGELVVMDAGAECSYYAADITRTLPASGRFDARQREIYDVVLGAQQAAIDAVKPGMVIGRKETNGSLMQIAYHYMDTHGKDAHGEPLGKYVLHGLSHHIGLDVHDPGDIMEPLRPGMVISIEPGIYIRDENMGVRIEDMVLVTQDGHRVLTEALSKRAEEIEQQMANR